MLDPGGLIASWTPAAEKVTGYSAGDVLGRHFSLLFTNEDREAGLPEKILREGSENGRVVSEGWRVRRDEAGSGFRLPSTRSAMVVAA